MGEEQHKKDLRLVLFLFTAAIVIFIVLTIVNSNTEFIQNLITI